MNDSNKVKLLKTILNLESNKFELEKSRLSILKEFKIQENANKSELVEISNRLLEVSENISNVDIDYSKAIDDEKKIQLAKIKSVFVKEYNELKSKQDSVINKSPTDHEIQIINIDLKILEVNKEISKLKSELNFESDKYKSNRENYLNDSESNKSKLPPIDINNLDTSKSLVDVSTSESASRSNKFSERSTKETHEESTKSKTKSLINLIKSPLSKFKNNLLNNKEDKQDSGFVSSISGIKDKIKSGISSLKSLKNSESSDDSNKDTSKESMDDSTKDKSNDTSDDSNKDTSKESSKDFSNKSINNSDTIDPNSISAEKSELIISSEKISELMKEIRAINIGINVANINILRLIKGMGFLVSIAGKNDDESYIDKMRNKYITDSFDPDDSDQSISEFTKNINSLRGKSPKVKSSSSKAKNIFKKIFGMVKKFLGAVGSGIMAILKLIPLGSILGPLIAVVGGFFLFRWFLNSEFFGKVKGIFSNFYNEYLKPYLDPILNTIKSLIVNLWKNTIKPALAKLFYGDAPDAEDKLDHNLSEIFRILANLPNLLGEIIKTILINRLIDKIEDLMDKGTTWLISALSGLPFGAGAIVGGIAAAANIALKVRKITKLVAMGAKVANMLNGGANAVMNWKFPDEAPGSVDSPKSMSKEELEREKLKAKLEEKRADAEAALNDSSVADVDKADLIQDEANVRGSGSIELGKWKVEHNGFWGGKNCPSMMDSETDINAYFDYRIDQNTHAMGDNDKEIIRLYKEKQKLLAAKKDYEQKLAAGEVDEYKEDSGIWGNLDTKNNRFNGTEGKVEVKATMSLQEQLEALEHNRSLAISYFNNQNNPDGERSKRFMEAQELTTQIGKIKKQMSEDTEELKQAINANTQLTAAGVEASTIAAENSERSNKESGNNHLESLS